MFSRMIQQRSVEVPADGKTFHCWRGTTQTVVGGSTILYWNVTIDVPLDWVQVWGRTVSDHGGYDVGDYVLTANGSAFTDAFARTGVFTSPSEPAQVGVALHTHTAVNGATGGYLFNNSPPTNFHWSIIAGRIS